MTLELEPITPDIGAYVHVGANAVLNPGVPEAIMAALNRYGVLVFPEVHMSDDTFAALTDALAAPASARATHRIQSDDSGNILLDWRWCEARFLSGPGWVESRLDPQTSVRFEVRPASLRLCNPTNNWPEVADAIGCLQQRGGEWYSDGNPTKQCRRCFTRSKSFG
jgi:hypothetical protein